MGEIPQDAEDIHVGASTWWHIMDGRDCPGSLENAACYVVYRTAIDGSLVLLALWANGGIACSGQALRTCLLISSFWHVPDSATKWAYRSYPRDRLALLALSTPALRRSSIIPLPRHHLLASVFFEAPSQCILSPLKADFGFDLRLTNNPYTILRLARAPALPPSPSLSTYLEDSYLQTTTSEPPIRSLVSICIWTFLRRRAPCASRWGSRCLALLDPKFLGLASACPTPNHESLTRTSLHHLRLV
jgi:hypothetical protein